jgi:PAS domain S-box-containing protein
MEGHVPRDLDGVAPDSSHEWRAQVLTRFGWALFLGALPLVLHIAIGESLEAVSLVSFGLLLGAAALSGLLPRLDYRIRGLALVVALLFQGAVSARYAGPTASVFLGLALGVVLAALFFGRRAGFLALGIAATSLLVFGLAGRLETAAERAEEMVQAATWVHMSATFALFTGLLVVLVSSAMRRMERSLAETRSWLADALGSRRARASAEEALRQNEERLRLALEAARMGTWERRLDRDEVVWSGPLESLVGLPPGGFGGTLAAFRDMVDPEDFPALDKAIVRAMESGTDEFRVEYRLRGAGPPRWMEGKGRIYRDASGRAVLLRGTTADISDRKRSEAALRDSEAELRALFASMEDVILVLDRDGRYVRIAPTNPNLLYRPPAELTGKSLHEVFPPDRADAFLAQIHRCLAGRQTLQFEYSLPIRGSLVWFAATVSPMTEDKIVWVARDVTERRTAEEALRESEERWRRISEATFEGIAFSEKGVMIDTNAQLAEMLGYEPGGLVGMPVEECVAPDDRQRVTEAIRSGRTTAYEHRARRKDGAVIAVETRARELTLRGRQVRVTAVRDMSERARLESELRRRETLAAMGSLVAGVAHEVRTPLFSISATLDALEVGAGTAEQQKELKELLRSQVRRLSGLMQDLLDYSRPPKLKLVPGGVAEPLASAVRICQAQMSPSSVQIETEVAADLPDVPLDAIRLEQVFENLVANAVQHSPRGGSVRVRVGPADGNRHGLLCTVEDEGPGLNAADLLRVFEPFFSRRKGGTGMGLAIAQRIVEAHGGTLVAANRPQGGAVFTVYLPAEGAAGRGGAVA